VASPDQSGRGIFVVDAESGELVWSVTPAANSATNLSEPDLLHSVPSSVTVLDSNGDEMTDRIYFGDSGGNLWRVDLPGSTLPTASQNTWQINQLGDFNGGGVVTDRRFFSPPDVVRIRLAGKPVDAVILGTGDRTNPNAIDVKNRLYVIRDLATATYSTARPSTSDCAQPNAVDFRCSLPLSDDDLYDISDNIITNGSDEEKAAAISDLNSAHGWRFNFANNGEKNLARTVTINGRMYVPTFTPSNLFSNINACEPQSGSGQMYVFDLYSGDRSVINLGSIIPNAISLHFSKDGAIHVLLPPGAPASSIGHPGAVECAGGVCDINESMRRPYGNFWYKEEY
jgi:type IV pilus assembly protein PilY1